MVTSFSVWIENTSSWFVGNLRRMLEEEKTFLQDDAERYLEWMDGKSLADRVKADNLTLEEPDDEIYAVGNRPESPVRNGMIIYGLYLSIRNQNEE